MTAGLTSRAPSSPGGGSARSAADARQDRPRPPRLITLTCRPFSAPGLASIGATHPVLDHHGTFTRGTSPGEDASAEHASLDTLPEQPRRRWSAHRHRRQRCRLSDPVRSAVRGETVLASCERADVLGS